jgi:hypothetical protein
MSALWVDAQDKHPNAQGHALIAEAIVRFIEDTPELSQVLAVKR